MKSNTSLFYLVYFCYFVRLNIFDVILPFHNFFCELFVFCVSVNLCVYLSHVQIFFPSFTLPFNVVSGLQNAFTQVKRVLPLKVCKLFLSTKFLVQSLYEMPCYHAINLPYPEDYKSTHFCSFL